MVWVVFRKGLALPSLPWFWKPRLSIHGEHVGEWSSTVWGHRGKRKCLWASVLEWGTRTFICKPQIGLWTGVRVLQVGEFVSYLVFWAQSTATDYIRLENLLVIWCFEPCQPLGITSGRRNVNQATHDLVQHSGTGNCLLAFQSVQRQSRYKCRGSACSTVVLQEVTCQTSPASSLGSQTGTAGEETTQWHHTPWRAKPCP